MPDSEQTARRKTILFFPLNSPGHINASMGIADRIKAAYNYRTVFLLLGPMIGDSIREHGHELVQLEEVAPLEDYEILDGEDPSQPVDEQQMRRLGRSKKQFAGVYKWPQVLLRCQHLLRLDPVEAFLGSCNVMEDKMVRELIDNEPNYSAAIESIKPDVIVVDAYYLPPCVIAQTRTPWVRLYSANPLMVLESCLPGGQKPPAMVGARLFSKEERERLRRDEPDKWQALLDDWQRTTERMVAAIDLAGSKLGEYLASRGCPPLAPGKQAPNSQHLNIYMYPKQIDYDQESDLLKYPARWLRCDSLMRKQESASDSPELRAWAQRLGSQMINKEAVVYFSLGSLASGMSALMEHFVKMLANDKKRLYVVSKGINGDKYELSPDNMIGANYLPQNYFLQRVDLAIVHGGNNSITECLFHGLPLIVMPVFADQFDNAQRIEDLGLGKRLSVYGCTQEELIRTVEEVLRDQDIIARARAVGQQMQQRDDLSKVTNLLDVLIREGHLTDGQIEEASRD